MGAGPNPILSKGYAAEGSAAFAYGEVVIPGTGEQSVIRSTSAGAATNFGVCQENVDAAKVTTGNVVVNVTRLGLVRVKSGGSFAKGAKLTNDTSARAVAASAKASFFAIAEEAAGAADEYVEAFVIGYTQPADTIA